MKMLLVCILSLCFLTVGCTKDEVKDKICDLGKNASESLATQVASSLSCSNKDAIVADIQEKLVDLKVCEEKPASDLTTKSAIGNVICPLVVEALVGGAVKQIPEKWGCTGGQVTEDLKLKLLAECTKVL